MDTKPLLYGLAGFFMGGLLVSVAATTFDKDKVATTGGAMSSMSMEAMTADLKDKNGDAYDEAFIANMIAHHQGALDMAKLSAKNANHQEIKQLSADIIVAQEKEIRQMRQWQIDWGYTTQLDDVHSGH